MARNHIFPVLSDQKLAAANSGANPHPKASSKPALAFAERGAMGGVARSISNLGEQAALAKELEAKLTAGQVVVELDPHVIDGSFISDRMLHDDETYRALRSAIEERGQESPILVRPHPKASERFQIAFGHRRHAAARDLGRKVRAVVKKLSDEELVLAQGQENSARANLSFIERARFARSLQDHDYARTLIMSALSVDKTEVSKMIAVTERIPAAVIEAIGPAPSTGRRRWLDLAEQFQTGSPSQPLEQLLAGEAFRAAASDERFNLVAEQKLAAANSDAETADSGKGRAGRGPRRDVKYWGPSGKNRVVKATENKKSYLLAIDQSSAPGFGDFLLAKMDQLFGEYRVEQDKAEAGGRGGEPALRAVASAAKGRRG